MPAPWRTSFVACRVGRGCSGRGAQGGAARRGAGFNAQQRQVIDATFGDARLEERDRIVLPGRCPKCVKVPREACIRPAVGQPLFSPK